MSPEARRILAILVSALAATPLAGCMEGVSGVVDRIRAPPPEPVDFAAFFEDFVTPQHAKLYPFPVERGAVEVRVEVALATQSPLPAAPPATPAQVEVSFLSPEGGPVGEKKTLDPRTPQATLYLSEFSESYGNYTLRVAGNGLSGQGNGARYNATLTVAYS